MARYFPWGITYKYQITYTRTVWSGQSVGGRVKLDRKFRRVNILHFGNIFAEKHTILSTKI
jgi:hypothetical protein